MFKIVKNNRRKFDNNLPEGLSKKKKEKFARIANFS